MSTPAYIILGFCFFNIVTAMARHGKSKGTWNAGMTLLDQSVVVGLLYWGGFFS